MAKKHRLESMILHEKKEVLWFRNQTISMKTRKNLRPSLPSQNREDCDSMRKEKENDDFA